MMDGKGVMTYPNKTRMMGSGRMMKNMGGDVSHSQVAIFLTVGGKIINVL